MNRFVRPAVEFAVGVTAAALGIATIPSTVGEILMKEPGDSYSLRREIAFAGGMALAGVALVADSIETIVALVERPAARH